MAGVIARKYSAGGARARWRATFGMSRIEDYVLLGDGESAALVGRDGSVDWLCWPRFDSPACFATLLGGNDNGRWRIAPARAGVRTTRRYRGDTLVLDTTFECSDGSATLTDFLVVSDARRPPTLVRMVSGVRGTVVMRSELAARFSYGRDQPLMHRLPDGAWTFTASTDALTLRSAVSSEIRGAELVSDFTVAKGDSVAFVLSYVASIESAAPVVDAGDALRRTQAWWQNWTNRCTYRGARRDVVLRSLLTLEALIHRRTGGMIAAPTTSLPQALGGVRNWDYRCCWLRDATLTLLALTSAGYLEEAKRWRQWLLRAVGSDPSSLRVVYGVGGEPLVEEHELPWLPGYEGAAPVRVGNGASEQVQLDMFGAVLDGLYEARRLGLEEHPDAWRLECALVDRMEAVWTTPDRGIWEVRGAPQHFTHSKMMCWVAVDRAIASAELAHLRAPLERWRALRRRIHDDVSARGYDRERGAFTIAYGSPALDSAVLKMPVMGFLPPDDERVRRTVAAIERELLVDGLLLRYSPEVDDGLPPGQGAFLPSTLWLAECLAAMGERERATALFERVCALRNDVGLLSEQYDVAARRLTGNFPQGFTHAELVNTALRLG